MRVQVDGTTRLRVNSNGGVSIGTNDSSVAGGDLLVADSLFVGEDIEVAGEVRIPTTTRWLTLGPADFTGDWTPELTGGGYSLWVGTNFLPLSPIRGYASVRLPQNAALNSVKFYLSDTSAAENFDITVRRAQLSGGSVTTLASASTSGSGGAQTFTRTLNTTIDNQNFRYFVYVETDEPSRNAHQVFTVQFEYTVDSALP